MPYNFLVSCVDGGQHNNLASEGSLVHGVDGC